MQLQIEAAGKILGWSVTFGPKSVENSFELDNFFELTTPTEQLLFNRVDFRASNFEVALQLHIEAKQKMLGRSVTFGPKSVEKRPQTTNFF